MLWASLKQCRCAHRSGSPLDGNVVVFVLAGTDVVVVFKGGHYLCVWMA